MSVEEFIVISFPSSHSAISAETATAESPEKIENTRLIPILPEISAGCGFVLKAQKELKDVILKTLKENGIEYSKIYLIQKENGRKKIEEII